MGLCVWGLASHCTGTLSDLRASYSSVRAIEPCLAHSTRAPPFAHVRRSTWKSLPCVTAVRMQSCVSTRAVARNGLITSVGEASVLERSDDGFRRVRVGVRPVCCIYSSLFVHQHCFLHSIILCIFLICAKYLTLAWLACCTRVGRHGFS